MGRWTTGRAMSAGIASGMLGCQGGTEAPAAAADLARLDTKGIPVGVIFEQGPAVLGLER